MPRLTETHEATVTNNQDPQQRGRIKVSCVGLLGDEETELPMFIEPVPDWGWFSIPDVGELIEIEVIVADSEDEQAGQSSIDQLRPRWKGQRFYGNDEGPEGSQPTPVNADFKRNYGKRRGFATPLGHTFIFDDTEGDARINLTWTDGGGEKFSFMGIDENGTITIGVHTGTMLVLDAKNKTMTLLDQHSNLISSDENGMKLVDKDGDLIELKGGNVQILGANSVTVSCKDATLDAGKVNLGGQPLVEAVLKGTAMVAALAAHSHLGVTPGPGVTGPPIPTDIAAFAAALSTFVFTK